jgi:PAS domain S-box-containing protein
MVAMGYRDAAAVPLTNLSDPSGRDATPRGPAAAHDGPDEPRLAAEEKFHLFVESVKDYALFLLDSDGRVATWNAGAERIKGYRADEIVGQHFSRFYPAQDVAAGKCEFELEAAARDGRFEDEGWRIRKDGSQFWANVVISAVRDRDGALIGFSKVTRDLTERRRAEEERAARLAAEQANRAKDELLAMVGHELRNPLAPIVAALQLMRMRGETTSSRELAVVERQVALMVRLVDDLLDVSRMTRGAVELVRAHHDLRDAIARAMEIAAPLIEERRHHIAIEAPDAPVIVDGDEGRLTQVFSNLLNNAAKYTPPGGHIRVTIQPCAGAVAVEIRDDGSGIDADLLPRVFDLFVQGRRGADLDTSGLGLGLSLVRSLVRLHGGDVSAHSDGPGRGSRFTVRLPTVTASAAVSAAASSVALPAAPRARRVLVVDDNEDARVLLCDLLANAGYEVRGAGDGLGALDLVKDFAPEVAILDIGLPVMDGYELVHALGAALAPHPPRFIALSGYGQASDRQRSEAAGFHHHLVKPVELRRLLECIAE